LAVKNTLEALANNEDRILLTLATGTGKDGNRFSDSVETVSNPLEPKTWKSQTKNFVFWQTEHLSRSGIQFLSAFPDDALIRIKTKVKKNGGVPTNGSITLPYFRRLCLADDEGNPAPYFGDYPADYFDFIIIDECHRGGVTRNWRGF
jgi:type I restriction enzyme R subunit